jgi:hypothetical protein
MGSFLATLKELFTGVGKVFDYFTQRSTLKNAPDVRDAAKSQSEVDQVNRTEKRVKDGKIEDAREDWSS